MPAAISRQRRHDPDQVRARRDFLWLDLNTRHRDRWPLTVIAQAFGLSRETVRLGIERAREARGVIENAVP